MMVVVVTTILKIRSKVFPPLAAATKPWFSVKESILLPLIATRNQAELTYKRAPNPHNQQARTLAGSIIS